jgi:DNA-binding SARP family transcriptional activator/TolB-like protein
LTGAAAFANVSVNMLRLFTFGGFALQTDDGTTARRSRPPRLALLAVLAAAADRGVSRERLASLFWPESDEERARHSLRQTLYALRNDVGGEVARSVGSTLVLDDAAIRADVVEFRAALAAGDRERAVGIARGPFLDGFYLPGAPAFERWLEEERARLAAATNGALLTLATEATRANAHDAAVEWWRQLTVHDPLSGRVAVGYLKALAARGDRAEALAFVRQHEAMVRRELEADPDADVQRLEAELRALPSPGVIRPAVNGNGVTKRAPSSVVSLPDDSAARSRRRLGGPVLGIVGAAVGVLLVVTAVFARQQGWFAAADPRPTFAVGFIREAEMPDSLRSSRVLTDMIATSLARIDGLAVIANSRLLELMRPGQDSAAGYAEAARRAGASDLLEGQLLPGTNDSLQLEMRRVELRTGLVREAYRVSTRSRAELVDSLTRMIARHFSLSSPGNSISEVTTVSVPAYRFYAEGLRAYFQGDLKGAQRLMHAALTEDSTIAMAWYYVDMLEWIVSDPLLVGHTGEPRRRALQYASRLPERERLTISAELRGRDYDNGALALAESLTTKYPLNPRGHAALGRVRIITGDWSGAVAATERAIALDSAAEPASATTCRVCEDFHQLTEAYQWWDSLPAVGRAARRLGKLRPNESHPVYVTGLVAQRMGDSATAYASFRRLAAMRGADYGSKSQVDLGLERYDEVERESRQVLNSSTPEQWNDARWDYLLALRNQGRLREAERLNRTGSLPGLNPPVFKEMPQIHNEGILALARGRAREAAGVFRTLRTPDMSADPPGVRARIRSWSGTLEGMAAAAAGDTATVRELADSVERWGSASAYGRDRKAHHYLRGLLFVAEEDDQAAVREFRAAIHSQSLGFTRVNYELARALLRLGQPQEAVATLQSALRGELSASCLYITHTELHELLAQAFDASGMPDSAAFHYRAVVKAWRHADPEFVPRRGVAERWLAPPRTDPGQQSLEA